MRLLGGEADLIFHHIDKSRPTPGIHRSVRDVELVPVVAPNFLRFPISRSISPDEMRDYVQCVIRDTTRHTPPRDYFLVEGARSWTVSDQLMKRELILQGMGWGHMPRYLIEQNLRDATLLPINRPIFQRVDGSELVAARRRDTPHGPIAGRLWQFVADQAERVISVRQLSVSRSRRRVRRLFSVWFGRRCFPSRCRDRRTPCRARRPGIGRRCR